MVKWRYLINIIDYGNIKMLNLCAVVLLCLFYYTPAAYSAKAIIAKQYGDYEFQLLPKPEDVPVQVGKLLQKGKQVLTLEDVHVSIAEYGKNLDLLGACKPKVLVLLADSGGAHCCNTYYFLELGTKLRQIQKIESGNSDIKFISQGFNKPYMLLLKDDVFAYFNASYANSIMPDVWLKYEGEKFVFAQDIMRKKSSTADIKAMLLKIAPKNNKKPKLTTLLAPTINLIYSGNAQLAWEFIDAAYAKYKSFDNSVGYKNSKYNKYLTAAELKEQILCKLKDSKFYNDLKTINNHQLMIDKKCDAV